MANYVDIETSAEAIQEDEELIEAVEAIVEIAAVSVTTQIMRDINSSLEQVQTFVEAIFPILVDYRNDPSLLSQDLQDMLVLLVFVTIAFFILSPNHGKKNKVNSLGGFGGGTAESKRFRRKSFAALSNTRLRVDSNGSPGEADMDSANNSLNSQSSWFPLVSEESDEERFHRIYPVLFDESKYFKLILPPECELVENSVASKLRKQQEKHQKELASAAKKRKRPSASNKQDEQQGSSSRAFVDEADDPAQRLQFYFRHFMVLVRSLFAYDYVSAAWTVLLWLQGIRKHRRTNSNSKIPSAHELVGDNPINLKDSDPDSEKEPNADHVSDESLQSLDQQKEFSFPIHSKENILSRAQTPVAGSHGPRIEEESPNHLSISKSKPESTENRNPSTVEKEKKDDKVELESSNDLGENKGLDGIVVDAVCFLQDHINNFVRNALADDSNASETDKREQDLVTAETLSSATEAGTESARSLDSSLRKTIMVANTSKKSESSPDDENDSLSLPENSQNPPSTKEENDMVASPESQLRNASWYFFESANSEESLKKMSLDVPVPDKNGYILGDQYLPNDRSTPLLVFVNSRSGPQQGQLLITQLKRLLNPIQVWDLAHGRPEPVLESFCVLSKLRILVCGGDGTVSWIISALDALELKRKWPPIAILPLGTGNDLARVHGWGGGYNNESLIHILEQISESYISVLDRWELTVEGGKKRIITKNFFNYFSVGVDAELALQVHFLRERRPEWFFSRFVNKAWYGVFGAEESIKGKSLNVRRDLALYADGVHVPLPPDSQGIIILNIDSYAGGVPLWSHAVKEGVIRRSQSMCLSAFGARKHVERVDSSEELPVVPLTEEEMFAKVTACDRPASCQDGYLDIVSVRGTVHLGQVKVGIGRAQRLCQCREIKIVIKKKVPVQIDGEPWRQDKCVLHIKRKPDPALMLHRSADDGGIETEMSKLLEWAEERNLIDGHVHSVLMKEFSRRIETKTRQRRVRSKEHNVIENLKRAIGSTGTISSLAAGVNGARSYSTSQKHFYSHYASQSPHFSEETHHDPHHMDEGPGASSLRRHGSRSNLLWGHHSFTGTNGGIAF